MKVGDLVSLGDGYENYRSVGVITEKFEIGYNVHWIFIIYKVLDKDKYKRYHVRTLISYDVNSLRLI